MMKTCPRCGAKDTYSTLFGYCAKCRNAPQAAAVASLTQPAPTGGWFVSDEPGFKGEFDEVQERIKSYEDENRTRIKEHAKTCAVCKARAS